MQKLIFFFFFFLLFPFPPPSPGLPQVLQGYDPLSDSAQIGPPLISPPPHVLQSGLHHVKLTFLEARAPSLRARMCVCACVCVCVLAHKSARVGLLGS